MLPTKLAAQSKAVLLLTLPFVAAMLVLQIHWWATQSLAVAAWTLGLSLLLALIVLKLRAATVPGALAGAAITASMTFSTLSFPYRPWRTALPAILSVSFLAWLATRLGRGKKERLGTAEKRRGRAASQIAANLGFAALIGNELLRSRLLAAPVIFHAGAAPVLVFAPMLAALAEAAADTVSSELGQVIGGQPRMITTLRTAQAGTDGAISVAGTLAGIAAATIVAAIGTWALRGSAALFALSISGAVFGLFFDSLLGATLERRGWLNNDAVNFLSTASAAAFTLSLVSFIHKA